MTQSAYEFLSSWFESDTVKAILAYYASIGTFAGPKSPGSAYVIMHHIMGEHEGEADNFDQMFEDSEKVKTLREQLEKELPAILQKLLPDKPA